MTRFAFLSILLPIVFLFTPEESLNRKAPTFELTAIDGEVINLEELQGKVVVLNFWRIGCIGAANSIPILNEIQEDYGDKVKVIAIAPQTKQDLIDFNEGDENTRMGGLQKAFGCEKMLYPIIALCSKRKITNEEKGTIGIDCGSPITRSYRIRNSYPATIIIDKTGRIQEKFRGGPANKEGEAYFSKELRDKIDELL